MTFYSCRNTILQTTGRGITWGIADMLAPENLDFAVRGLDVAAGKKRCLYVSEAGHDTAEGFDVMFPSDFEDVELLVVAPENWDECDRTKELPFKIAALAWGFS